MAQTPPNLKIPPSTAPVQGRIIDTTTSIKGIELGGLVAPKIKGHEVLNCPAYSFLIEHASGRKLLFDLRVRTDHKNLAPRIVDRIKTGEWEFVVKQGVRE